MMRVIGFVDFHCQRTTHYSGLCIVSMRLLDCSVQSTFFSMSYLPLGVARVVVRATASNVFVASAPWVDESVDCTYRRTSAADADC